MRYYICYVSENLDYVYYYKREVLLLLYRVNVTTDSSFRPDRAANTSIKI